MRNLIFLGIFSLAFFVDIVADIQDQVPVSHVWHEILLLALSLIALIWQFIVISKRDKRITVLDGELLETRQNWQAFRAKNKSHAEAIRKLIDQQFAEWQLSDGEKDVALLLLKGLTMKEIADIRKTHEKTVRQQASGIYRKASLSGRQELSAFFLEDILSTPISDQ